MVREDGYTIDTLVKVWEEFDYGTWSYPGEDGWRKCYWITYANKNINEHYSNFESIVFKIPVKTDTVPIIIKAGFSSLYNKIPTVKMESIEVDLTKTVLIDYQMDSLVNWFTNQSTSPDSVQMIEFQIETYSGSKRKIYRW